MSRPRMAPAPSAGALISALAACALLSVALGGCGGSATFVSVHPPPRASADAWYRSSVPEVRA
ncbi:MAG: hypothetical protein U9Q95_03880, partial [Candidatus Eisenbacteria bacterium]|nr:hypothetical protein [Candidatus Eisenbacteria bacterium]